MSSLTLFIALQVADLLTTLFFLGIGVQEGNPLIRLLMKEFSPLASLVVVKSMGFVLGFVVYFVGASFKKINCFYVVLVVWNLVAIILQLASK